MQSLGRLSNGARPRDIGDWPFLSRGAQLLLIGAFVVVPAVLGAWVYRPRPYTSDFALYYRDARVGWSYGWSHMYDLTGFNVVTQQLGLHNHDPNVPSLSVPLLTWLVAGYARLPLAFAYAAWLLTLLAAILLAWRLLAPAAPVGKGWHLLLAALFLPLVFGLTLGSAVVLLVAALAVVWWLLQRGQSVAAGLVLCLALVRPQVCLLIPICLLASGRRRQMAAFVAGVAVVALAVLAVVPLSDLQAYLARISAAAQHPTAWEVSSELSLAGIRPVSLAVLAVAAASIMAVGASILARHTPYRDAVALSAGILGSLVIAPYIHIQDLALLLVPVWLWLPMLPSRLWVALVLPVAFAANLEMSFHTILPATLELLGLILLAITFWKRRRMPTAEHLHVSV
jgi:hypothetical protein